jgi:hypothetical protein
MQTKQTEDVQMPVSTDTESLECEIPSEMNDENGSGDEVWTTVEASPDHSISRIIRSADQYNNVWHLEGLWQPNTFLLVHSLEGEFKSVFAYQVSEALATGQPLLRKWMVSTPKRVGILQTEMPDNMVGDRLKAMYPDGRIPRNLIVSNEGLRAAIRVKFSASEKFQIVHNWLTQEGIQVLVWDTINSMLSVCGNPNTEEAAAQFYDRLQNLPLEGALVVRHDGKPSKDSAGREGNQKVRGSNLHAEIASAIIQMRRPSRRSNRAQIDIGKLRHDTTPEPIECWFDSQAMRLTLLPPPVAALEAGPLTREALNDELHRRFNVGVRTADELVGSLAAEAFLLPTTDGHERLWTLNAAAVSKPETAASVWLPLVDFAYDIAEPAAYLPEICELAEVAGQTTITI